MVNMSSKLARDSSLVGSAGVDGWWVVALLIGVSDDRRAVVGVGMSVSVGSSLSGGPDGVVAGRCVSFVGGWCCGVSNGGSSGVLVVVVGRDRGSLEISASGDGVVCRRDLLICWSGMFWFGAWSGCPRMLSISLVIFFGGPSVGPAAVGLIILTMYGGFVLGGLLSWWLVACAITGGVLIAGGVTSVIRGGTTGGGCVCVIDLRRLAYGFGLSCGVRRCGWFVPLGGKTVLKVVVGVVTRGGVLLLTSFRVVVWSSEGAYIVRLEFGFGLNMGCMLLGVVWSAVGGI